jgi:hypothetical protein
MNRVLITFIQRDFSRLNYQILSRRPYWLLLDPAMRRRHRRSVFLHHRHLNLTKQITDAAPVAISEI